MAMTDDAFPIGKFEAPGEIAAALRNTFVAEIAAAPALLRRAVDGLSDRQLDTPYRDGGWTVRQVVHHLPDSHVNAYIRFKLAVTEEEPAIRTYDQTAWAALPDGASSPIGPSLDLFDALHRRWVTSIRTLAPDAFERRFLHPVLGPMSLNRQLALYAWHGKHHTAHITTLAVRQGWDDPLRSRARVLETERLVLRRLASDDAPFMLELLNDAAFLRYIGDRGVRTLDEASAYILNGPVASYQRFGFGLFLVASKASGQAMGICGLLKRDVLEDVDIGFAFLPAFWSKGYATESVKAVKAYAGDVLGLTSLAAVVQPDNGRSLRLLDRMGFCGDRKVRLSPDDHELRLLTCAVEAPTT